MHITERMTICGLSELPPDKSAGITHLLSILDPGYPVPDPFGRYDDHHRLDLRFLDVLANSHHDEKPTEQIIHDILRFGREFMPKEHAIEQTHLLIHCHMGISRSTAAMSILLAQHFPEATPDEIFLRIRNIRSIAWPNSLMIKMADRIMGRNGHLLEGLYRHYAYQLNHLSEDFFNGLRQYGREQEIQIAKKYADLI
ncbi:MAG: protein-tyrosine-phosphatase [Methylocystaceae bacterium]|nr:protein-tyrosine-phosphatase [Methylocystaceae bacterium]